MMTTTEYLTGDGVTTTFRLLGTGGSNGLSDVVSVVATSGQNVTQPAAVGFANGVLTVSPAPPLNATVAVTYVCRP